MNLAWSGHYLSGLTADREDVTVTVTPTGLRIDRTDRSTLWWPYGELRQTQGAYAGEHVRLERGDDPPEVLVIPDRAFLDALRELAPEAGRELPDRIRHPRWRRLALLAAGALAAAAAGYLWVIPALAGIVARRVPVAWERQVGDQVVSAFAARATMCDDSVLVAAVEGIVGRLAAAAPANSYAFDVRVIDDSQVNAFAAPGGHIVLLHGLVARTETPEELAGVLAHEMEHVIQRHGTQAILRQIPLQLFVMMMGGEIAGARDAAQAMGTLGALRYGRRDEEEADREGLRLLVAARIDPDGMIRFFETLRRAAPELPRGLTYLSTHPRTESRIAALRAQAAQLPAAAQPLGDGNWAAVRARCRSQSAP